jgi:Sec-independent protein translocase protein TatA
MDFLGLGIPEIIAIIILALIFIGPRDLPKVAGKLAKFIRDLRMMTEGFRTEWEREINAVTRVEGLKELKEELISTRDTLRGAGKDIREAMTIDLEELDEETEAEAKALIEAKTKKADAKQPAPAPKSIQEELEEVGERTIGPPEAEAESEISPAASEEVADQAEADEKPVAAAGVSAKNGRHSEKVKSPAKVETTPEPVLEDLPDAIQINLEDPSPPVKAAKSSQTNGATEIAEDKTR